MAPLKAIPIPSKDVPQITLKRFSVSTRSRAALSTVQLKTITTKRKADSSPSKDVVMNVKRSALSDLPRNANIPAKNLNKLPIKKAAVHKSNSLLKPVTKVTVKAKQLPTVKTIVKPKNNENAAPPDAPGVKVKTRLSVKALTDTETGIKIKEPLKENNGKVKTRLSNEFEKTEESLYSTALEEPSFISVYDNAKGPCTRRRESQKLEEIATKDEKPSNVSLVASQFEKQLHLDVHQVPTGVIDFDKENWNDVNQSSQYAMDIFNYLKEREEKQEIPDYISKQVGLNAWMRALLVDWMVEIQESFELNHETLYLGVKLVDMYLSKVPVKKDTLQLVGATSMFIASKFDERIPPLIDDFLYICDGAYTRKALIRMEMDILKICGFDLGISISYRFLRRYARCAKISMPVLTLARFILEMSLMNYDAIFIRDSKLASASLYLALKMKNISGWTTTLQYYTGYKLEEIMPTVRSLNEDLHKTAKVQLTTIRNKYSHKIFFEVAKTPLLAMDQLIP